MTLVEWIEKQSLKTSVVIAIDGMCAAGKTSLALYLHDLLGGNIFHMDDFFLPPNKRTEERMATPGGNVDYERFLKTVLLPIKHHQDVLYQPFDCHSMAYKEEVVIPYHSINIIEGSYALHPALREYYDDYVVLCISETTQKERLLKRNPLQYEMFKKKWIPLENKYFEYYQMFKLDNVFKMDE